MRRDHEFPLFERFATIEREAIQRRADGADLVLPLALSSEFPVDRWFGKEILMHDPKSIRLGRLNDGASVLFNHNPDEIRGSHVPGSAQIGKDRVLRADIRLTAATQPGRDTIALVEAGHLTKASEGYRIHKVIEKSNGKSREIDGPVFERAIKRTLAERGADLLAFRSLLDREVGAFERAQDDETTYLVTDWEPYETTLTTLPADPTVGVGRQLERQPAANTGAITMSDNTQGQGGGQSQQQAASGTQATRSAAEIAEERIKAIANLAKAVGVPAQLERQWIESGADMNKIGMEALEYKTTQQAAIAARSSLAFVDMEPKEQARYSVWRALAAVNSGDWSEAGLELEASRAVAKRIGRQNSKNGFFVPVDIQTRGHGMTGLQKRDLTVGTDAAGGFLRGTDNISFIELLRNRSVCFTMGARRMSGLVGNVTIPKQTAGATAYWLSTEATAITEGSLTFAQGALTPRTVGAYVEISRLLQLQSSPDAEGLVMADLAAQVALAVDSAGIAGTGTEQPQGIIGTASVGAFTGTSLAAAGVLDAQADVAGANALTVGGSCGYVFTPAVAALLMQRPELPSTGTTRLWQGNMLEGTIFGFRAMTSNQMPSAKGIFGNWQELVIGEWGVLELATNPAANFPAGITGLRAMYTVDVLVRYAGAFSCTASVT